MNYNFVCKNSKIHEIANTLNDNDDVDGVDFVDEYCLRPTTAFA